MQRVGVRKSKKNISRKMLGVFPIAKITAIRIQQFLNR